MRLAALMAVVGSLVCGVRPLSGQVCDTTTTRTTPHGFSSNVIRSVTVRTDAPVTLPIAGRWLAALRRTSETAVVRRQLLFVPGERVDTIRIAETLRRLRERRLYADVFLVIARCAGSDSVDLLVVTRDAWTLRPIARVVPPATVSIGAEDRNVLGTGRLVSLTNEQSSRGHGGAFAATDPFMFGTDVIGAFRLSDIGGDRLIRASVRHHELDEFDPWRVEMGFGKQRFGNFNEAEHPLGTLFLVGHVGHLIGHSEQSVTLPYIGPEYDGADVLALQRGDVGAPAMHQRKFVGLDVGLLHRAAVFDTASWFADGHGFLDVPVGFEGDVILAPGTDRAQHAAATHYDAWIGRMWIPNRGQLITTDVWTSGYFGNVRANHTDRVAVNAYADTWRGFWGARLMFEQLIELDPDERVFSLATIANDPSLPAVPQLARLANRAVMSSLERSMHLFPVARASVLDGGLFAAGSARWDAARTGAPSFAVGVVGARLRLLSANGTINSMRVDVTYPVVATGSVVHRPLLSITITPMFDESRQRDGRRKQ
jgi:hypothetical protein